MLTVLQGERAPDQYTNPYITQLFAGLSRNDVRVVPWRYLPAILGRYDVVHLHWPEYMVAKSSFLKSAIAAPLAILCALRWRILRTPVVVTVHNTAPHDGGVLAKWWLRQIHRLARVRIHLAPPTSRDGDTDVVISHPSYAEWFAGHPAAPTIEFDACYFGGVRPYKGVDDLVTAFAHSSRDQIRLSIRGACGDSEYEDKLRSLTELDSRITANFTFASDPELKHLISASRVAILPYRGMENSGAALLSLSIGTPILVPSTPSTNRLLDEFGTDWVYQFGGELTAKDIEQAIDRASIPRRTAAPDLSRREWSDCIERHVAVYSRLVGERARPTERD